MLGDWFNLIIGSVVVGLTVVGEIRDILLLKIKMEEAFSDRQEYTPPAHWRFLSNSLIYIRWFIFLPNLCMTVPALVWTQGGDALSICMNTVAVTFLVDLDNIVYDMAFEESTKQKYIEDGAGLTLRKKDETWIVYAKEVHGIGAVLLMVATTCSVPLWMSGEFLFVGLFGFGAMETVALWQASNTGKDDPATLLKTAAKVFAFRFVPCALFGYLLGFVDKGRFLGLVLIQPAG